MEAKELVTTDKEKETENTKKIKFERPNEKSFILEPDIFAIDAIELTSKDNNKIAHKRQRNVANVDSTTAPKHKEFREQYAKRKNSSFDLMKSYIYSTVAYLSVKLSLDAQTTDFNISVNDSKWRVYGDIVVKRTWQKRGTNNEEHTRYAIRCINIFEMSHINNLSKAQIKLEKEYGHMESCKKEKNEYDITRFVIFTSSSITSKFPETVSLDGTIINNRRKHTKANNVEDVPQTFDVTLVPIYKSKYILNMSTENIFRIDADKTYDLPTAFLHTGQMIRPQMIEDLIKNTFTTNTMNRSFFDKYYGFITGWARGNFYLNKKDVVLKLGELLLEPYIRCPNPSQFKSGNFEKWDKLIEKIDVVVTQTETLILRKPFKQMIADELGVNLDPMSNTVECNKQIVSNIRDPYTVSYLYQENFSTKIKVEQLYKVFWKAEKLPLLISLGKNIELTDFVLEIISFVKAHCEMSKFVLVLKTPLFEAAKNERLNIFSCLDDIKNIDLEDIKIGVSDDLSLSLKEISRSDSFILKWITPSLFFDMISDQVYLKKDDHSMTNVQSHLKIILDDETRKKVRDSLFKNNLVSESVRRLEEVDAALC